MPSKLFGLLCFLPIFPFFTIAPSSVHLEGMLDAGDLVAIGKQQQINYDALLTKLKTIQDENTNLKNQLATQKTPVSPIAPLVTPTALPAATVIPLPLPPPPSLLNPAAAALGGALVGGALGAAMSSGKSEYIFIPALAQLKAWETKILNLTSGVNNIFDTIHNSQQALKRPSPPPPSKTKPVKKSFFSSDNANDDDDPGTPTRKPGSNLSLISLASFESISDAAHKITTQAPNEAAATQALIKELIAIRERI